MFYHFSLVGLGIPLVLFAATLVFHLLGKLKPTGQSGLVLNLVIAGLALAGLGFWAFFSLFIFKRLWKIFAQVSTPEKVWEYLEGSFLFVGVGISMVSALGVFYFIFTGDFSRSMVLFGLSAALYTAEALRFRSRANGVAGSYI